MRTILSIFLMTLLGFGLFCNDAAAKRFGGGRSFGVQRPMSSFSTPYKPASSFNKGGTAANSSRWGGMLGGLFGGLLLGGLLTSLFMGNGVMTGLLTWLVVGAFILLIINLFRRKIPSAQGANSGNPQPFSANPFDAFKNTLSDKYQQFHGSQGQGSGQHGSQQGFKPGSQQSSAFMSGGTKDDEDFLREAKVKFIRLQTAYDQQNLDDIREFSSPEVVAEIQMQFQEQEGAINQTEVVSLEAEILGREQQGNTEVASVRFTGSIKENSDKAEALNEIWHFQRTGGDSGKWIVSGVQQIKPL